MASIEVVAPSACTIDQLWSSSLICMKGSIDKLVYITFTCISLDIDNRKSKRRRSITCAEKIRSSDLLLVNRYNSNDRRVGACRHEQWSCKDDLEKQIWNIFIDLDRNAIFLATCNKNNVDNQLCNERWNSDHILEENIKSWIKRWTQLKYGWP